MNDKIKVLICEDMEPILRKHRNILSKDKDIEVVGTANNGYDAVMQAALLNPDVVLMDIGMEHKDSGIEASKQITGRLKNVHIVILTIYEDEDLIYKAFQAGICDYLLKDSSPEDIIQAVKDAYYERSPIRPRIAEKIRKEFARVKTKDESMVLTLYKLMQLTPTELSILDLMIQGYSRSDICKKRHVEMTTMKTQINSILKKMGAGYTKDIIDMIKQLDLTDLIRKSIPPEEQ